MEVGHSLTHVLRPLRPDISEAADPVPDPPDFFLADVLFFEPEEPEEYAEQSMSAKTATSSPEPRRHSQVTSQVENLFVSESQEGRWGTTILKTVRRYIDYIAGVMVLFNSVILIIELEVEGRSIAFQVGLPYGQDLRDYLPTLRAIDATFVLVFLLELLCRLGFDGLKFCLDRSGVGSKPLQDF